MLLDVGCGTGDDVRALAELVAPGGRAIGVDVSAEMVAEARRRGGAAAEFLRSDAQAIDLPDDAVDGARAERVLQHLDDPARAVAEMARVVRPGGIVVTAEPDWDTLVIDAGDPETAAAVARAAGQRIRTRRVGRALRRLALDAGLVDVSVAARVLLVTEAARAATLFDLPGAVRRAVADGLLEEGGAEGWLAELATAGADDRLLVAMTAFTAAGAVPE